MEQDLARQTLRYQSNLFFAWWFSELKELIPAQVGNLSKRRQKTIGLIILDESITFAYKPQERSVIKRTVFDPLKIDNKQIFKLLNQIKYKHKNTKFGIMLSEHECFIRSLEFPTQSKNKLHNILNLDLEHATPFKRTDIYHDYLIEKEDKNIIYVKHIIVKKSIVDNKIALIKNLDIPIQFIDVFKTDPNQIYHINLLRSDTKNNNNKPYNKFSLLMLFLIFLSLICASIWQIFHNQAIALNKLDNQLKIEKAKALQIRKKAKKLETEKSRSTALLQKKVNSVGTNEIWNELTKQLPDTTWIDNLKISKQNIQITGHTVSAEDLIRILEKSELFSNARFLSPVQMDTQKQKERFSISLTLTNKTKTARKIEGGHNG